jgi:hypothetical protein
VDRQRSHEIPRSEWPKFELGMSRMPTMDRDIPYEAYEKLKLSLRLIKHHEDVCSSSGTAPRILNLGTR